MQDRFSEWSVSLSSSTVASKSCYRNELPDAWVKRCMSTMSRGSNLWQMGGSEATRLSDMPGCCELNICNRKGVHHLVNWTSHTSLCLPQILAKSLQL